MLGGAEARRAPYFGSGAKPERAESVGKFHGEGVASALPTS